MHMLRRTWDGLGETHRGAACITAAVFLMALADALVKALGADLPLWQIYLGRGLVAIPLLLALGGRPGAARTLPAGAWAWVALRSLLLAVMWLLYYAALPQLELATAAVCLYTAPLVIGLLSGLLLREPVPPRRWGALLLGFLGVLLALRPWQGPPDWRLLLPLLAALCYALAMLLTRSRCREVPAATLALALNATLLLAGLAGGGLAGLAEVQAADWRFLLGAWAPLEGGTAGLLALLGLLLALYTLWVARAYQWAPAATVAAFDYAYLLFAALWGCLLFGERPAAPTWLGMAAVAAAGWLAVSRPGAPAASPPGGRGSRRRWWRRPAR